MVRSLDKKWKEFLFAFSGFGPNLLMILMGSYYSDALNPAALEMGEQYQAIMPGVCFIMPALFPILFALGKVFDGLIDIPFAYITDTLSTKWGRRRPAIAVCMGPMIISYVMCWIMPVQGAESLVNTIWVTAWSLIFFASYTMCLIAFYGSLSSVCSDEAQRLRVSGYKSFFDTITYCLVYALVPVILQGAKIHIDKLVFFCIPLMLTIAIPLFLIKEGEKYGYPEDEGLSQEKITIGESIRLTFKNKVFRHWLYVNCCTFFGLQMFLSAMNGMIIGGMGMNGGQMALLNTCAFAPVPVMLYLFNKVKARKGVRMAYQSCLLLFAVAIMSFFLGSRFVLGEDNIALKLIIGAVGGVCGSWSIGVFFMMPYLAPAQISSIEEKLTGKNHSAMYFAGNAVATSIVGAISGSLVYEYIKNTFIAKGAKGIAWATDSEAAYRKLFDIADGAAIPEKALENVFNFGNLLVPFIVCTTCIIGFFIAFKMPKDYTPTILAREFKRHDPSLDISEIEKEEVAPEKGEIIFVQVGLSILSGFVFGFIWSGFLFKSVKEFDPKFKATLWCALSCFVPFASVIAVVKACDALKKAAEEKGIKLRLNKWVLAIVSAVFCILPVNIITLALLQHNVNKLYKA